MGPEQTELIDRVRMILADEPVMREISMFGGRSFMVNEKMLVSARKDGSLLVRVSPGQQHELLRNLGSAPAQMGTGRVMGPGWIEVKADAITHDVQLASWIEIALEYSHTAVSTAGLNKPDHRRREPQPHRTG